MGKRLMGLGYVRFQHGGQQVNLSSNVTEEFFIVSKKRGTAEHQQASNAEKGDSGSFVINNSGQICGLLYGATSGLYGPPNHSHSRTFISMPALQLISLNFWSH